MLFTLNTTKQFEKDYKLCVKRGLNIDLLNNLFELLENTGTLPLKYKPHKLRGEYMNHFECHIQPDWLLIWFTDNDNNEIYLVRTGSHGDLF
jgi:mRNA interferase YafQ